MTRPGGDDESFQLYFESQICWQAAHEAELKTLYKHAVPHRRH
jgi:hypothetical protein